MNIFQLRCFLSVANTLSFAAAATLMNVSQPAISHQIKALESELNAKLFRRSTRVVELTAEGQAFIPDAKSMVAIADHAMLRFSHSDKQQLQILTIGCSSYTHLELLTEVLRELSDDFPSLHPRLLVVPHDQLFHLLETETADIVFDFREDEESKKTLVFTELCQSALVCVCRVDHPAAQKERMTSSDLAQEKLIFCDPITLAPDIANLQWKLVEGRNPADLHFCSSSEAAVILAKAGFGLAILPELLVQGREALVKAEIEGAPKLSFGMFYKPSPADTLLRKFIQRAKTLFEHRD